VAIANDCGLDGSALLAAASTDSIKNKMLETTQVAHEKEVFGSPTYSVEGELFWGQDRLDFLERAVSA